MKNILIAGGAGFIGSYVNKVLNQQGYNTIVFDDLSRGDKSTVKWGTFVQGDIGNIDDLDAVFQKYNIDAVMHFAAYISVPESVEQPMKYYDNNVVKTTTLLNAMLKYGVKTFIFSSSAAIFGVPEYCPIPENHPCAPINPYGETKLIVEKIVRDYSHAYGLKASCLRYFNAAGGDPDGDIHNKHTYSTNIIPVIIKKVLSDDGPVTVFGTDYETRDGTCIRDYIHIHDLASAHLLALERLLAGESSCNYNLGNGQGFTVREVIDAVEQNIAVKVPYIEGPRRAGDPPELLADSKKIIAELGWKPEYPDVATIVQHAWKAMKNKKIG
jgi:UDP-glucose 4-epimerase